MKNVNNGIYKPTTEEIQDLQSAQVAACRDFYTERRFQHSRKLADVRVSVVGELPKNEEVTRIPWSPEAAAFIKRFMSKDRWRPEGFNFREIIVDGRAYLEF